MDQVNHTTDGVDLSILGDTPHGPVGKQILHEALACLSCSHRRILKRFLAKISTTEMTRLKTRLCSLGVDQHCRFIAMLSETTCEQFSRYLNFFVTPPYPLWEDDPNTSTIIDTTAVIPKAARVAFNSTATCEASIKHQNLFDIPQEILDMTLNRLFHAVFIPGVLQPADYPSFDGPDCFVDKSFGLLKSRTFRAIDPARFNRYKEDYWTKNTWVIEQGRSSYTVDFLNFIPAQEFFKMRSIYVKFTTQDYLDGQPEWYINEEKGLLQNLEDWLAHCNRANVELQMLWWEKFSYLANLRLDRATLDFSDAYSLDGRFIGVETASTLYTFGYGMPELTVLAPNEELRKRIHDAVVARNR